jgi:hypothetical protein
MVKDALPVAVEVPLSKPAVLKESPAGKVPPESANVNGPGVPIAVNAWLYAEPLTAPDSEAGPSVNRLGFTVSVYPRVPAPVALVTPTVKLVVPLAAGVPLSTPPGLSVKPSGSVPDESVNVNGPGVPVAVSV